MPHFIALVEVWLKKGLVDAEGKSVKEALNDMGYPIIDARVGKVYRIELEANSKEEAEKLIDEICRRLLANPVKDIYRFSVHET
ncbi:MAG: phosphoribosylformylglycinamidine synthase subunit PurS [Thermoprotei archaeon]|nr:phosphoribosylformylglycinamidine synthase subunit PurS [Thermoprotei archaeon]